MSKIRKAINDTGVASGGEIFVFEFGNGTKVSVSFHFEGNEGSSSSSSNILFTMFCVNSF